MKREETLCPLAIIGREKRPGQIVAPCNPHCMLAIVCEQRGGGNVIVCGLTGLGLKMNNTDISFNTIEDWSENV